MNECKVEVGKNECEVGKNECKDQVGKNECED